MSSDVDLLILVPGARAFAAGFDPHSVVGTATLLREGSCGILREVRVALESGLEVEFGFVDPCWAGTDPVAPGTRAVVTSGMIALHYPLGLLRLVAAACAIP